MAAAGNDKCKAEKINSDLIAEACPCAEMISHVKTRPGRILLSEASSYIPCVPTRSRTFRPSSSRGSFPSHKTG